MKKQSILCKALALVVALAFLAALTPLSAGAAGAPVIKAVTYYDKNPDPGAVGEQADYPAVWVEYEGGSQNLEVFALQEVDSQAEARNGDFGIDGFQVGEKWYRPIGLWTVEPSEIIDKDNGMSALTVPLYYNAGKPLGGSRVFIALFDYENGNTLSNPVELITPEAGETTEVEVTAEEPSQPEESTSESSGEVSAVTASSEESSEASTLIASSESSSQAESASSAESSAPAQPADQGGSPLPWILLGVGAAAVLGGVAFAVARKRKS